MFTEADRREIDRIAGRYAERRASLLPVLWFVQEREGFISLEAMKDVASLLDLTPAFVFGVVSFYTMFNQTKIGRFHIQLCTNICCALRGADKLLHYIKERLGIGVGETTADGLFTLSTVECLGSCGTAPMMQVNSEYYEDLTEEKVDRLLEGFRRHCESALSGRSNLQR